MFGGLFENFYMGLLNHYGIISMWDLSFKAINKGLDILKNYGIIKEKLKGGRAMVKRLFRKLCTKKALIGLTHDGFLTIEGRLVIKKDLLDMVGLDYQKYINSEYPKFSEAWDYHFKDAVIYDLEDFEKKNEIDLFGIPAYEISVINNKIFKGHKLHIDFIENIFKQINKQVNRKIYYNDKNYSAIVWVDDSGILAVSTGFKD